MREMTGMAELDLSRAVWRRSTRSGGNGGNCVEVAAIERGVAVRDSKNPGGAVLAFAPDAWHAFTDAVRSGRGPSMLGR
jgi:hypothetical protein